METALLESHEGARITQTVTVQPTKPAPEMAMFSSAGPNIINQTPGVNVLEASSPLATAHTAGRSIDYNIISGTSTSCPHVSALAAIIKSVRPSWSPAAIKSAIMKTATAHDNVRSSIRRHPNGTEASPFDYGSKHVNSAVAVDPGLVNDFDSSDVIDFLCRPWSAEEPHRTVAYYGERAAVYKAEVDSPGGAYVSVTLSFKQTGGKDV
ncbi:hypothetical protein SASPL_142980 [Salvia splendens]|uniref:Peptidase S8/S53 domain-containing protein n=1 Tax=Salvia splendens TaxID=180675 RepID=A0A8X8Z9W4_SALSN|nr:hypothetical protein SASPL_142980 [Salvia splendens]